MRADLVDRAEQLEAVAEVEAAHEARAKAGHKYRCAPHGEVRERYDRLKKATAEALRAELVLARIEGRQP